LAALRNFRVIYGSVRHHLRSVEQRCGVSGSQLWILQEIARTPGIGISDLAALISIHQSTCSLLVEKLVKAKLVARSRISSDQRRVGLELTRRGQRTVSSAPGPAEGVLPQALQGLSSESLKVLNRSLRLVIDRLELDVEGAADRRLSDL
jgi:DNA-binding MarR family transcriptional regulator